MEVSLEGAIRLLAQSTRIVITGHIHPDGDCLGSMLALYEHLNNKGKQVQLLLDSDVPSLYNFLPGSDGIYRPGNKTIAADLLVVLDASDAERISNVKAVVEAKILNIDHHKSNTKFADYWFIDTRAAATGEIILELLHLDNAVISPTIAMNLYTAIVTDCGFFRYANTTSTTLRHAAELMDLGAKPNLISEFLETRPLASLVTLQKVLETLEVHDNGKIAMITISQEIHDNAEENTEGLINYPRNIEGIEIAMMFTIVDEHTTRVSFRSRNIDVSLLALSFGGGGHARAAGCTVSEAYAVAKKLIFVKTEKLLSGALA